MDAEGIYLGAAVNGGISYDIAQWRLFSLVHYFGARIESVLNNEKGVLRIGSVGIGAERFIFKNNLKKLYSGGGIVFQQRFEDFEGAFRIDNETRKYVTGMYKIGYLLSDKNNKGAKIALELVATGPYTETYTNGSYLEIFTQIGFGFKIAFYYSELKVNLKVVPTLTLLLT